jgi:hypothetical protein
MSPGKGRMYLSFDDNNELYARLGTYLRLVQRK